MHSLHQWREWTYSAGLTHTGSDLTDLLSVAPCCCSVCCEHSCERVMGMPWDLPRTVIQHQNGDWWCRVRWCTGDFCHGPTSNQPQSAVFEWQNKADSRLNHADRVFCVYTLVDPCGIFSMRCSGGFFHRERPAMTVALQAWCWWKFCHSFAWAAIFSAAVGSLTSLAFHPTGWRDQNESLKVPLEDFVVKCCPRFYINFGF